MPREIAYRSLPHWRLDGATYFVTWRLMPGQRDLSPAERTIVAGALRFFVGVRCELLAWVVMNDHVHVVVRPLAAWTLDDLLHSRKSFTANRLRRAGRTGRIWLTEAHDRIVRDPVELEQKVAYVLANPQRRWPGLVEYAWAGTS